MVIDGGGFVDLVGFDLVLVFISLVSHFFFDLEVDSNGFGFGCGWWWFWCFDLVVC